MIKVKEVFRRFRAWTQYKGAILDAKKEILFKTKADSLTMLTLHSQESGVTSERTIEEELVVSLTTYDKRLYEVYITIESIMQQSLLPNRIILWLADEYEGQTLPITLQKQQARGLEIRYCKDIRSYKKLIPTLKLCPESVIITIDDDVIYMHDMIENLVNAYRKNPNRVYCNRMYRIVADKILKHSCFKDWRRDVSDFESFPTNIPIGVGGVLYPPHSLSSEVFNERVFMSICKYADDYWFKAMSLMNGIPSCKVFTHNPYGEDFLSNDSVQDIALCNTNVGAGKNNKQFNDLFNKYDLWNKL